MSEQEHDEAAAQQAEQDRLDELARQNEEVRRAEHPDEFAGEGKQDDGTDDGGDSARTVAPVAPAGTGAEGSVAPLVGDEAERRADDLSALAKLEQGARELRRRLFGSEASL